MIPLSCSDRRHGGTVDPILERAAHLNNFLWILNDVEKSAHAGIPQARLFLDRWYAALEKADIHDVVALPSVGSHVERLTQFKRSELPVVLLRTSFAEVSLGLGFNHILGSARRTLGHDFDELVNELVGQIKNATDQQILDEFNIYHIASGSAHFVDQLVEAVYERIMQFDDVHFLQLDSSDIVRTFSSLPSMDMKPPSKYQPLAIDVALRCFSVFENLSPEEIFASQHFDSNLYASFHVYSESNPETRLISSDRVEALATRLENYVDGLSSEQLAELDANESKRIQLYRFRNVLGAARSYEPPVSNPFGPLQPVSESFLREVERALVESRKQVPAFLFGANEFRQMFEVGLESCIVELVDNYLALPDKAFVGFNPSRIDRVLAGRDGLTTMRHQEEYELRPRLISDEKIDQLQQKIMDAFMAERVLFEVPFAFAVAKLINEKDQARFHESFLPRLYKEIFEVPMPSTEHNIPSAHVRLTQVFPEGPNFN